MTDILVSIPGEEAKVLPTGISAQDALKELVSNKQRKQAVAVLRNGEPADLTVALHSDAVLELITNSSEEGLHILRHSSAHTMAQAVKELFGEEVK
ncbi:MAG: threonine--tRNA ligase, partial [Candidatus Electrothrix sp. AR4]|nr:threonine--tRNA ligase [Candidatus Electrothrix sp. AR4]